jgi:DNA-binding LacI/PurR family transcriptional regulator
MTTNPRPTQKDVAKHAGVSVATVSQVINNRSGGNIRISEDTRKRVWQSIHELGYRPNVTARSLRTQKTYLLALMVPDITNPFYPELIRGVQGVATHNGFDLLIYDADDRPERESAFLDAMLRRHVDGVAMIPFHLKRPDVERLTEANIAVSVTVEYLKGAGADVIQTDDTRAIDDMIEHLLNQGHRRIAHLSGTMNTLIARGRMRSYQRALASRGVDYDENLVQYGNFRADCVPPMIDCLFSPGNEPPTAIFAANDLMAIAAIHELQRRGLRVPEDVAVCGYDDIPEARTMIPPLTTISQNTRKMGQLLAQLLIERLASSEPLPERVVPFEFDFVIRDST